MKRRTGRSVSAPCTKPWSCLCSSCRSLPTRTGPGPSSDRPCREAQALGFVVQASLPLDFVRDVQLDQLHVSCQTKGSPWLFVKRNKYVFGWWFTFSLSQASSFDSRTKCLFSSSRNAFRPCWLWNETIAQPYLSVRLVNGLAYNYSDVGEYEQGECMYVDLTPTQVLSCLFLNQWELLGSQSGQDWISW